MKFISIFFVIIILSAAPLFAQQSLVGISAPIAFNNNEITKGNGFELSYKYKPVEYFSFETSFGGFSSNSKGNNLLRGNLSVSWTEEILLINLSSKTITPYGGFGIGFFKTDNALNSNEPKAIEDNAVIQTTDIKNRLGFLIKGGIEVHLTSRFLLNTAVQYIFNNTSVVTSTENSERSLITRAAKITNLNELTCNLGFEFTL